MNKRTERAITIALAIGLIVYFCYQVAYGEKETCPGFMDKGKCLTIGKQPYQFAYHDGKQAEWIAFFQVGDSSDSTTPSHTDHA